jgi:F420-non-reducing hydrogenase iron-sulfur subunit
MTEPHQNVLTIFHCYNALKNCNFLSQNNQTIKSVKLPCSSMIREVFLLRAFEAGSDAVIVLGCPEGTCRYVQGNLRSQKRVERVKKMLDDIGIGAKRLNFYNIQHGDEAAVQSIVDSTISERSSLGPNPAA